MENAKKSGTDPNLPLYTISVVSELLQVHPQTLRLYEREGLVKPSRSDGNTRLYSDADIEQLRFVLNMTRTLGVNLAGIEIIMSLRKQMEIMREQFEELLSFVKDELSHIDAATGERIHEAIVRSPLRDIMILTTQSEEKHSQEE